MKIRSDFVTNSSSSSYICDICGEDATGWDMVLDEAEMYQCVNGHTICEEGVLEDIDFKDFLKSLTEVYNLERGEDIDELDDDEAQDLAFSNELRYSLPERYCPICQFVHYSSEDMVSWLVKTRGISKDEVFEEIKKVNKRRKKLYDNEYINFVCAKFGVSEHDLLGEIKGKFASYAEFSEAINK